MQFGMCNEHYDMELAETFERLAALGYDGVEVSPWTFTDAIGSVTEAETQRVRTAASATGLDVIGIPRVFRAGEEYHIGTPDETVRERTREHLEATVRCCGAIGGDVVIFGSPSQRNHIPGVDERVVWEHAVETFSHPEVLSALESTGVTLCMEPLSPPHTDFVTTAAEATAFVEAVDHPNVGLCLDGYHLASETATPSEILAEAAPHLAHFHADNTEGRGSRYGTVDYGAIAETLRDIGYDGYVSLEIHADILRAPGEPFTYDTDEVAADSIDFLTGVFAS